MNTYKLGSLFDGSGGFPLAGTLCGITPVWAAEVEPYPIAVTRSRFPNMKHLGDISKVNGAEIEPVDIITFGSPCQDLSVAGKRAGLKHTENGDDETTRSGLFMEAVRIIKEMREATGGQYPRWALWENVPGAFSSNKGEDFRVVCEELIKVVEPNAVMPGVPKSGWAYADSYRGDGWSLAYRVLDAQYWGVPQRRRRIYLVADFGGECAREVLFEREGLRGYFAEGRTPWQGTTADAENSVGADDRERKCYGVVSKGNGEAWCIAERHMALGCGGGQAGQGFPCAMQPVAVMASSCKNAEVTDGKISPCLMARAGTGGNQLPLIAVATQQGGAEISENGVCPTITAAAGMSGNNQPWICKPAAYGFDGYNSADTGDKAATLGVNCGMSTGRNGVCVPVVAIDQQGGKGGANYAVDVMPTICSDSHGTPHAVAYAMEPGIAAREGGHIYEGVSGTLRANAGDNQMAVAHMILDDQGGQQISVREDGKCPTLRAEMHGNVPCVMESAGFCPEESAKTRGVGYAEEQAPTLRAGAVPGVVCKCFDARGNGDGDICNTVTGDHNNRITDYSTVVCCCIDGDKIGKAERSGGSGLGIRDGDKMYTLTAKDAGTHGVAYSMETFHCTSEEEKTTTLKARDYKDPTVVCYALDRAYFNQGANALYTPQFYEDGTVPTLVAKGPGAVAHGVDCRNATEYPELNGTLQAKDNGGFNYNNNQIVRIRYIVRRLTPTECARLQGFADEWGHIDPKSDFSDEDYRFWLNVRNTHAAINGKATKEYTKAQMLTWYNKLHTDSSEYKMWGNGIALPTALYVMQGIAERMNKHD